jgi:NitT/TauT family transport system permease protein
MIDLTTGSTLRNVVLFSVPIILQGSFQVIYQLINRFWVGHIGKEELAAVSVGMPVIFLMISLVIGIPLGVLMGRSRTADDLLLPWVNVFLSAPLSALVPVIMVLAGIGKATIVLTVVLFAIWIVMLNARAGVRSISPSLIEMSRSFGATFFQSFVHVYLWAALPEIIAGVRLGLIRAVKGVIIGQLLISVVGFGTLFEIYLSHFLREHLWAVVLVIFAFAFLINELLAWAERSVRYYAASR